MTALPRAPDYPSAEAPRAAEVDRYFSTLLAPEDAILRQTLATNAAASLPAHDVSATQGQLLALLVRITQARRVLEIGTLGGYSTIRMARALPPGGTIITIEADPHHAEIARANIANAGLAGSVDVRTGAALDLLPSLDGPFDLIFVDADKRNNPAYLRHALDLARPGTVILFDNVVRGGAVIDAASDDPNVRGMRDCLAAIAGDPRLAATAIQTVGEKGWDGFAIAVVDGAR